MTIPPIIKDIPQRGGKSPKPDRKPKIPPLSNQSLKMVETYLEMGGHPWPLRDMVAFLIDNESLLEQLLKADPVVLQQYEKLLERMR